MSFLVIFHHANSPFSWAFTVPPRKILLLSRTFIRFHGDLKSNFRVTIQINETVRKRKKCALMFPKQLHSGKIISVNTITCCIVSEATLLSCTYQQILFVSSREVTCLEQFCHPPHYRVIGARSL